MSDWWGIIKEPRKIPRPRVFGKKYGTGKPLTPEMEADIEAVVEEESKPKPKKKPAPKKDLPDEYYEPGRAS